MATEAAVALKEDNLWKSHMQQNNKYSRNPLLMINSKWSGCWKPEKNRWCDFTTLLLQYLYLWFGHGFLHSALLAGRFLSRSSHLNLSLTKFHNFCPGILDWKEKKMYCVLFIIISIIINSPVRRNKLTHVIKKWMYIYSRWIAYSVSIHMSV